VTPAGVLVTVPAPVPAFATVNLKLCSAKVEVTVVAAVAVTMQGPVPLHPPPLQPTKVEPVAGIAVKVTTVPLEKLDEQVVPHTMPSGVLVTLPFPRPTRTTVRVTGVEVNVAVTVAADVSVTAHEPVPAHSAPDQPAKTAPDAGMAVSVTVVPASKVEAQSPPQSIPAGALVTVPLPVRVTVSGTGPLASV